MVNIVDVGHGWTITRDFHGTCDRGFVHRVGHGSMFPYEQIHKSAAFLFAAWRTLYILLASLLSDTSLLTLSYFSRNVTNSARLDQIIPSNYFSSQSSYWFGNTNRHVLLTALLLSDGSTLDIKRYGQVQF